MKPKTRRQLAAGLTAWVIACQAGLVIAFVLDPSDPPRGGLAGGSLGQALWALAHEPAFYPLALLLVTAGPATWLAWSLRGPHRGVLLGAWVVFGSVVGVCFAHRVWVMVQVLMRHGAG